MKKVKNMKKQKTRVGLILDQSGSMAGTKHEAAQNYNEQIQQMKLNAKDQDIQCSLVTFNGEVFEHFWLENPEKLEEASAEDYITSGSTAMRDAIGYTVNKLISTTDPNDEDIAYLVIIISDGDDNASRHFNPSALRELITSLQNTNKWTFTYMGCDENYVKKIARETNIPLGNMAVWSNKTRGLAVRGLQRQAKMLNGYYKARAGGQKVCCNVYSDNASKLADFSTEESLPIDNVLNTNTLNDGHKVNMVCKGDGVKAFSNSTPVNWS